MSRGRSLHKHCQLKWSETRDIWGTYHSDDLLLDNSDSGCRSAGAEAIARLAVSAASRLAGSRLAAFRLAALRQTVARQTVGSVGGDRVDGDVFGSSRSGGDRRGRLFLLLLVCGRRRCLERVSFVEHQDGTVHLSHIPRQRSESEWQYGGSWW